MRVSNFREINITSHKSNRRSFLKSTAAATLGFAIVPRHVLGQGFTAPSNQLNVAVIGGGGKGYSDAVNAWNNGASNIAAICDVDYQMAEQAFEKFPKAKKYKDYRILLDEMTDIDAITVSTPDHTHAVITMNAMKRGIHTYVQNYLHTVFMKHVP
jgi:hypothetical protein